MTQIQFETEIKRLMNRLATLRAVQTGDAKLKRVRVRKHYVKGFWVSAHSRYIAPVRKQATVTRGGR